MPSYSQLHLTFPITLGGGAEYSPHEEAETRKLVSKLQSSSLDSHLGSDDQWSLVPSKANDPQAQPRLLCPWALSFSPQAFSGKAQS